MDNAKFWRRRSHEIREAAEAVAWDGAWYRRAFDDGGEPWGSVANEECRIDSIAQSWAVLADASNQARAVQAIRSAAEHLIDQDVRLVRLLTPPFNATPRDPGYIRAYPPGVRENGGQYTHAATWLGLAFVRAGDGDMAYRIFDMINPAHRTATPEDLFPYRREPYVTPADVRGAPPYEGRAGWTWYTGAAAWSWRLAVEGILGLELRDGKLNIDLCLPRDWNSFSATVRGPKGALEIEVQTDNNDSENLILFVEGQRIVGNLVEFPTDESTCHVEVRIPRRAARRRRAAAEC